MLRAAGFRIPWIVHLDLGGCNGCAIEILACLSPKYGVEKFGTIDKEAARADVLVVNGVVTHKVASILKGLYARTPGPKAVVAVGSCAITKGIFHDSYNLVGPMDKIIPVDVYVPGCPPKPEAIIDGIIRGVSVWKEKSEKAEKGLKEKRRK